MTEDDLKKRTKRFALRVLKLVAALPRTIAGRTVGNRAACRARSKAEFVAKLGVVEEEADESAFWLEMIIEGGLLRKELVQPLWNEANELVAIMTSSRKSASRSLVTVSRRRATPIANHKSKI